MEDPHVESNAQIDGEAFRQNLNRVYDNASKRNAGAKPFHLVLTFKLRVVR